MGNSSEQGSWLGSWPQCWYRPVSALLLFSGVVSSVISSAAANAAELAGRVVDTNGRAVAGAMVTVSPNLPGPTAWTVYSDATGHFHFPAELQYNNGMALDIALRSLGHELDTTTLTAGTDQRFQLTVIARTTPNQAAAAPASAWLGQAADHETVSTFVMDCVGCHQVPAPQLRHYAAAIADMPGTDRHDIAHQGWTAMVQYMNLTAAEEFNRGPDAKPVDQKNVYSVGDGPRVIDFLTDHFQGRMDSISGYDWGAPLAVTPETNIREYEVPAPNAVREALLLGSPAQLYLADVSTSRLFKVDPTSGYTSVLTIPSETEVGPHSLHRGPDGSLWVAPFISSVVAHLDTKTQTWQTWGMKDVKGNTAEIHDLSFGAEHSLLTDNDGNIWFSDVGSNSVGYLDPSSGLIELFKAPPIEGRAPNGSLYGIVMTSDREHVWFSQLSIGNVGSFNIKTRQFEEAFQLPTNAGPRRLTISDDDILYVPLYGRGQLVEYDTRNKKQIGIYDLPDRATAPYSVTWDPGRQVVWVTTANGDVLYRFDPKTKQFSALPLPRHGALVRMVDVDPTSGVLVGSYGNIVQNVHGPRMAFIIEPGDRAYAK
jgi:streptogramin lyase